MANIPRRIHIIGAGGVGMSGLALLAQRMGAEVTASDQSHSPYLQKLAASGIKTWVGSSPENIPADAHVYFSTAIKKEDAERNFAETHGLQCEPRHPLLKLITANYFTIAVAGCHGKTTTSAWVADLLERAGQDPTALIGGTVPAWNSNYREGAGTREGKLILVIEADESDRSFLSIVSALALVTNIDLDHTDVHDSLESLENDFLMFAPVTDGRALLSKECGGKLSTLLKAPEAKLRNEIAISDKSHGISYGGRHYDVGLAGTHNLMNATLVLQLGLKLGLPDAAIAESLCNFSGVNRRLQRLAEFPTLGLTVIDDYAHHPREVKATLAALASQYERMLIFWEPHRLSRFVFFHEEFAQALEVYAGKHELFTLPLYASGDKAGEYPEAEDLFRYFQKSPYVHVPSMDNLGLKDLTFDYRKTAAVFMGAGLSSEFARAFVKLISLKK